MAFIETTPADQATGAVRDMYERQQKSWGFVPNYAKVFSHRPEIMNLWADMLRGIRSHVDPRRFELVTLAAAHALRSSYCSLAHAKALTEHLPEEEIPAMLDGSDMQPASLSEAEVLMMAYARKVATAPWRVTAGEIAGLQQAGFSDPEIFDIAAVASARSFFSGLVEGLGAEADASFMELSEPLRRALVVGRPVGFQEPERLTAQQMQLVRAG